jgi:hypothetical protein
MSENNFQHHNRTQITDPVPKSHVFIKWIWAVPEEPGMGCRPRSKILRMFIVYNVFSVIVSALGKPVHLPALQEVASKDHKRV